MPLKTYGYSISEMCRKCVINKEINRLDSECAKYHSIKPSDNKNRYTHDTSRCTVSNIIGEYNGWCSV